MEEPLQSGIELVLQTGHQKHEEQSFLTTMINSSTSSRLSTGLLQFFLILVFATPVLAVRVKDVASLRGARDNELIGFGIVVGLDGTGDSQESLLSRKPIVNALERIGISLKSQDILGRSIAAVWLTATLPPFAKSGQRLDVTAATIGDSVSLRGGILIMAPMRVHRSSRFLFAAALSRVLSLEKYFSIGLRPGEYGGRKRRCAPRSAALAD